MADKTNTDKLLSSAEYAKQIEEIKSKISDLKTEVDVKSKLLNSTNNIDAKLLAITKEEVSTAQYAIKAYEAELKDLEYLYEATKKLEENMGGDIDLPGDGIEVPLPDVPGGSGGNTGGHPDCGCAGDEDTDVPDNLC